MPRVVAIAIVVSGTNGNRRSIVRQVESYAAVITRGFSIDIAAELVPAGAVPFVQAGMACLVAIAIVFLSANGQDSAITRNGDGVALVTGGFAFNITAELAPGGGARIPLIDADVSG